MRKLLISLGLFIFIETCSLANNDPNPQNGQDKSIYLSISTEDTIITLLPHALVYADKSSPDARQGIPKKVEFARHQKDFLSIGGSNPHNVWVRFQIKKQVHHNLYLYLSFALPDTAVLYSLRSDSTVAVQESGKSIPFYQRRIKNNRQLFLLEGDKGETVTYYLNIRTAHPITGYLQVGTEKSFYESFHIGDLLNGIFFGVLFLAIAFNFCFWILLHDRVYLFYVLYQAAMMGTVARLSGHFYEFLHPNLPIISFYSFALHGLAGMFGLVFSMSFLQTAKNFPRLHRLMQGIIGFYLFDILLVAIGRFEESVVLIYTISLPATLLMVYLGLVAYLKGIKTAFFFTLGCLFLAIGFMLFALQTNAIIPSTFFTRNGMYFGVAGEAIFLTFAVAHRFSLINLEKNEVQRLMIESLRENERLVRAQNELLEQTASVNTRELEKAQTQLAEYAHKLEKSNQELTDFAHIASHDLKAPIRNIGSFTQLLEKRLNGHLDERNAEYLGFIKTNVRQSTKLIEDLLNYSKIDKNIGDPLPTDLNDLILIVKNNLQTFLTEYNAEIIADELPILRGHSSLLVQLFQNLISNGLKYNRSETPTVRISTIWNGDEYTFKIADNGIGIPPQYQEQIFGMFRRLHSSAEYEGSGIGLAFCQRIVKTYGGRIWLESIEGQGSIFYFTLPKAQPVTTQFLQAHL
jgi:signal transduction histidine kinase